MYQHLLNFAVAHWQAIGILSLYALIAAISTMPPPGHKVSFYEWFYDWTHTLINSPAAAKFRIPVPPAPPEPLKNDAPGAGKS